jgi:hypothetical protein
MVDEKSSQICTDPIIFDPPQGGTYTEPIEKSKKRFHPFYGKTSQSAGHRGAHLIR